MVIMRRESLKNILSEEKKKSESTTIADFFAEDDSRAKAMSVTHEHLLFDYSKQRLDAGILDRLFSIARETGLEEARDQMFGGHPINMTEQRPVLHVALRNPGTEHVVADGSNVMTDIHKTLHKMREFSSTVRSGQLKGAKGTAFRTVVNIGIGGSQLGPEMVYKALGFCAEGGPEIRFISNIDGDEIAETVKDLRPETTLFIVASKTFTTDETMTNARSARAWISANLGQDAIEKHFVAVSSNLEEVQNFGISAERIFGFWDWVGGRYSIASAIGLPVMIAIGWDNFKSFLDGMHQGDEHFRTQELEHNIPVLMGLIDVWNGSVHGSQAKVIAPYSHYLKRLPAYLQQLVMESNGKSVRTDGTAVIDQTSMAVMGEAGTDAQHAYFQQLHQGSFKMPVDFIGYAAARHDLPEHSRKLTANMIAQAEALAFGKGLEEILEEGIDESVAPHKVMQGDRPSNTFLFKRLTPESLGFLIALYEHSVFVQGVMWQINSFDQWGVELGKKLAKTIEKEMKLGLNVRHDGSTKQLIDYVEEHSDLA